MFVFCCVNPPNFKSVSIAIFLLQVVKESLSGTLGKNIEEKVTFSASEMRSYLKVCSAIGQNASEIFEKWQSKPLESSVSKVSVCRWVRLFESRISGISENREKAKTCTTTTSTTVAAIKAIIDEDIRVIDHGIADRVGIHSSSVLRVLHKDFGLKKLLARWIPHILSDQNKGVWLDYAKKRWNIRKKCDKRRLGEIGTDDETWINFFEPHRKSQNKT